MSPSTLVQAWLIIIGGLGILGCEPNGDFQPSQSKHERRHSTASFSYVETGDLTNITKRSQLRILIPRHNQSQHLPRQGFPFTLEEDLAHAFADSMNLTPVFITVADFKDLIPQLLEGKGDLIAANFTATSDRKKKLAFTVPIAVIREQLVARKTDTKLTTPDQLQGRTLVVQRSSSFWTTALQLRSQHPGLTLTAAPEYLDPLEILQKVADGDYDLTIADSNLLSAVLSYEDDLRTPFELTGDRPVAWGIRPDSHELRKAANQFLNEAQLTHRRLPAYKEDLPGIQRHKVLRVLTRNNPATFFVWHGHLMGFEYELARHYAKKQKLRVEMVIPPTREDLYPWLLEGKGDVIAASLTIVPNQTIPGIAFSTPYNFASEIVVTRSSEPDGKLESIQDLVGRTVAVRRSSAYWNTIERMQASGVDVKLLPVPEEMETEEIIEKVAVGEYDLTVADSHILDIELTWRDDIRAAFPLGDPRPHAWAVRAEDTKLLEGINAYVKEEYKGLFYNLAYQKYFKNQRKILKHAKFLASQTGQLSPYDEQIKRYADQYGFDWRLIVAQMFQESRFNPKARSWVGAVGLMQVLPKTAQSLGFKDLSTPEHGIHAGVKYLNWVRDRFEPELSVEDRMWFSLAGYNVGQGHVTDARRLARELGLNPNRWFGHVEQAILKLSRRQYARKARHGYCRGTEPVKYVSEIKNRYEAYLQIQENSQPTPSS